MSAITLEQVAERVKETLGMRLGMGAAAQADYMEDFVQLVRAGVQQLQALEEMHRTATGVAADATRSMIKALREGQDISQGMRGWFDPVLCDAAMAGNKTGDMYGAVTAGVEVIRTRASAMSTIAQALAYPVMILSGTMSILIFFALKFFPEVSQLVPPDKWTTAGRLVLGFGTFLVTWGPAVAAMLVALLFTIIWSMPRYVGPLRARLDRIPPWSVFRQYHAASFMLNLSLLLRTGVRLREALEILGRRNDAYVASHIWRVIGGLRRAGSGSAAESFATGFLSDRDARRLQLYERADNMEQALHQMGRQSAQSVSTAIRRGGRVLTFLAMGFSAALIALVGFGLFETVGQVGL